MKNKLILLCLLLCLFAACNRRPDLYKVVKIKDGDTMELLSSDYKNVTVRLAGIDCPEKSQAYGQKAKQFSSDLCFGKYVELIGDEHDRYGRTIGTIKLEDGTNVNNELVKNGYAWQYTQYSNSDELGRLQQQAKMQRLGLWQDENPTPPWLFRKKRGGTSKKSKKVYKRHSKPGTGVLF
jgi:micrococcal nuclease